MKDQSATCLTLQKNYPSEGTRVGNMKDEGNMGRVRTDGAYAGLDRAIGGWMRGVVCRLCGAGVGARLRCVALALAEGEELVA